MQSQPAQLRESVHRTAVALSAVVAEPVSAARDAVSRLFISVGVPVNAITLAGFLASGLVAVPLYHGRQPLAGVLLIVAGACDILDGAVARLSNGVSAFGGYLDSVVDRYSDFAILFGILLYVARHWHGTNQLQYLVLWSLVVVGASTTSYTRARAELVIPSCKVGFMERPERTVTLIIGLLCGNLHVSLWILAVMANLIAVQRILYARLLMRGREPGGRFWLWTYGRMTAPHFALCAAFILMLILGQHLIGRP